MAAPVTIEGLYDHAFVAYRKGDAGAARKLLSQLLAAQPSHARALLLMAVVIDKAQEQALAIALVEASASHDPTDASAWYNLGVYEGERHNLARALDCYERAVALDPVHLDALGNGCELLRRMERFEEALEWADRRLALAGDHWSSHLNRGVCLFHLGRWEEAEAANDRALKLDPGRAIIAWERFPLMLHQKRFHAAWEAFERRFEVSHLNGVYHYPFEAPLWKGEPLSGRHIVVHNEQGLGDQLMFACALQEVIDQAGRVTLVMAPPLVDVFKASFPGAAEVLPALYGRFAGDHPEPPWLKRLPKLDYQVPIGSLMAVLRDTPQSFESPTAYFRPSDAARERWKDFDAGPGLKIGLCWASNPATFRHDSARRAVKKSMALETMAPLAGLKGVSLVSVLNWTIDPMPAAFEGKLMDVSRRLTSLDETAALIEKLDLVVTVDTAVAHMAGAMGKETWLLLHDFPDCRWEVSGDRSYWYPDMRLFRQSALGDWDGVVAEVATALKARADSGKRKRA